MDPIIGSAIVGAGSGILSSIGAGKRARKQADYQQKLNLQMAKYNEDASVRMWNMQNAYNDPKAQMTRLKEAGLNPHLVYGNGSVANTAAAPEVARQEAAQYPQLPNILGEALQGATSMLDRYQNYAMRENNINLGAQAVRKATAEAAAEELALEEAKLNFAEKEKTGWWSDTTVYTHKQDGTPVFSEWFPSPYAQGILGRNQGEYQKYQNERFRKQLLEADLEIKRIIAKDKDAQRIINEWHANNTKNNIPPNSKLWERELKQMLGKLGIDYQKYAAEVLRFIFQ